VIGYGHHFSIEQRDHDKAKGIDVAEAFMIGPGPVGSAPSLPSIEFHPNTDA